MKANSRFSWLFVRAFFILSLTQPFLLAQGSETILRKIETRRGSWTALNADVALSFKTTGTRAANCEGVLLYNRLDERILLNCRGSSGKTVFAFKTDDKNFELYLPSRKTIYKGNVFALEDSPAIESHLRPLDLYRALKPAVFAAADIVSLKEKKDTASVTLKSGNGRRRKIEMTKEGDVTREAYEGFDKKVSLVIERSGFETIREKSSFPKRILIKSLKDSNVRETLLDFKTIAFPAYLSDDLFIISAPKDTSTEEID